jgi:hypothetical protein
MNITSARGTLHCRKTRIPCGNQLVICAVSSSTTVVTSEVFSLELNFRNPQHIFLLPQRVRSTWAGVWHDPRDQKNNSGSKRQEETRRLKDKVITATKHKVII